MFIEVPLFQKLPLPWKIPHLTELSCSGVCPGFRKYPLLRKKPPEKSTVRKMIPLVKCPLGKLLLEKSPLTKRWKMKTSFYYQYMTVVWHMKMVVQWVSQKILDGECAPAVFPPYKLVIIFNKSLLKHSFRCSSKLFFRSWNGSSSEDLPRRWEEDCLGRRLLDNVFWKNYISNLSTASLKFLSAIKEASAEI